MREKIISAIEKEKIIVIVRGVKRTKLSSLIKAIYDGGMKIVELTFSADGSVADKEIADNISMLNKEFGDKMLIGAGTVLTEEQVELAHAAGAKFIISPDVSKEVISKTLALGMVSIPGAITPTEIQSAHKFGADFVKLFPVSVVGVDYLKVVRTPLSHVKLIGIGGVDQNNLAKYIGAGLCGVGVGSSITNKKLIENDDWKEITRLVKEHVNNISLIE